MILHVSQKHALLNYIWINKLRENTEHTKVYTVQSDTTKWCCKILLNDAVRSANTGHWNQVHTNKYIDSHTHTTETESKVFLSDFFPVFSVYTKTSWNDERINSQVYNSTLSPDITNPAISYDGNVHKSHHFTRVKSSEPQAKPVMSMFSLKVFKLIVTPTQRKHWDTCVNNKHG